MHFVGINPTVANGNTDQTGLTDQQILSSSKMIIHPNGQVTIGTNCPASAYKLGVKGGIITDEVNVLITDANNCWPDYVFDTNYQLPTLKSVEEYTKQNHHLQGVPSAQEIADEGMNVAELNTVLLKKTEELTLYLIELSKVVEEMKKENDVLKQKMEELEKNTIKK